MNKSWIQAWKQGAFGVGGTCVYFQRMIFQGASNESGGSVCRAIKIRSKTDHRGLMVNKELFDSRLWTIRAVIAIGRRFAWAASAGNCPRIRVGWRRNGKREREKKSTLARLWLEKNRPTRRRSRADWSVPSVWWNVQGAECASGMLIADRPSRTEPRSNRPRMRRLRITRWFRLKLIYFEPETRRATTCYDRSCDSTQSDCLLRCE